MIKEILKYQGNSKYICILALNEKDELLAFCAKVKEITFENSRDYYNCFYGEGYSKKGFMKELVSEIVLKLNTFKNDDLMTVISVKDVEEYEHICFVLEHFV